MYSPGSFHEFFCIFRSAAFTIISLTDVSQDLSIPIRGTLLKETENFEFERGELEIKKSNLTRSNLFFYFISELTIKECAEGMHNREKHNYTFDVHGLHTLSNRVLDIFLYC